MGFLAVVRQRVVPHSSVHVGVDDHPVATPPAPCMDLKPAVVPLQRGDNIAVFAGRHCKRSRRSDREPTRAGLRKQQVSDAVIRET